MLTLRSLRAYVFKLKKYQEPMEKWLFPIILLLYPFIGVNQGVDITDTTYSLGNYLYGDAIDPMWFLATYIPNLLGSFFSHLPGGDSMLGMNMYCTLIISITALFSYYMLQRWIPGWMTFLGCMIAESLCWCPRVILYNYLTYLFFTLGVLFLLHAMTDYEKKMWKFALAGFFLGLNVMVRFPNILEAALIVILWYYEGIHKREIKEIVRKTLFCILGYAIGFLIPYLFICVKYGFGAYGDMVGSLFSMTKDASDYAAGGMFSLIIKAWITSLSRMAIMVPCIFASAILLMLKPGRYYWVKRIIYVIGLVVLIRYFFMRGVFTRSYYYYDSMFEPAMMFLVFGLMFLVLGITPFLNGQGSERAFCLGTLLIIFITPLGSNNYTYPLLNNMFIVAPAILWMFRRVRQAAGSHELHFTWKAMYMAILVTLVAQAGFFHLCYSFVDGTDGEKRSVLVGSSDIPRAAGMYTTEYNAETVSETYEFLKDNGLAERNLMQFGKAPGLAYLYNMDPAIFSTWPDLDSNTVEKFEEAIEELRAGSTPMPVVIINPDFEGEVSADAKYDILLDFLDAQKYNKVFDNERFMVYAAE